MKIKEEMVTIICIVDDFGFNEKMAQILNETIKLIKPDFFEFNSPNEFRVFLKQKNESKAQLLIENIKHISKNTIAIGCHKGVVVFKCNVFGKIKSSPIGNAINIAYSNRLLKIE